MTRFHDYIEGIFDNKEQALKILKYKLIKIETNKHRNILPVGILLETLF